MQWGLLLVVRNSTARSWSSMSCFGTASWSSKSIEMISASSSTRSGRTAATGHRKRRTAGFLNVMLIFVSMFPYVSSRVLGIPSRIWRTAFAIRQLAREYHQGVSNMRFWNSLRADMSCIDLSSFSMLCQRHTCLMAA